MLESVTSRPDSDLDLGLVAGTVKVFVEVKDPGDRLREPMKTTGGETVRDGGDLATCVQTNGQDYTTFRPYECVSLCAYNYVVL